MTVSYMPLMRAQQRRHDLPASSARQYATAADMRAASSAARRRLMNEPARPVRPEALAPMPAAAPAPIIEAPPTIPHSVPINMLMPPSWRLLLKLASLRHGIPIWDILGPSRLGRVVAARAYAMTLIYQHTQFSTPAVGRLFGRHHATVLHSLRRCGASKKLVDVAVVKDEETSPIEAAMAGKSGKPAQVRAVIIDGYAEGLPVPQIAQNAGVTYGSARVIAHQLRLEHPYRANAVIDAIPLDRRPAYKRLTRGGRMRAAEAAKALGEAL